MKKKTSLLLVLFLVGVLTVSSQVKKGDWFINGLNLISFQAGSMKSSNDMFGDSKTNVTQFYYGPSFIYGSMNFVNSPTINYGIIDKLSGGIFLNINLDSEKDEDDNKSTTSVFAIGPSVRYYFLEEKKFLPFAEAKIGFGSISSKYGNSDNSKSSLVAWYLGTGGTYFFKPQVGLDFTLGYGGMVVKDKDSENNSKTTMSLLNFGIGLLVGF